MWGRLRSRLVWGPWVVYNPWAPCWSRLEGQEVRVPGPRTAMRGAPKAVGVWGPMDSPVSCLPLGSSPECPQFCICPLPPRASSKGSTTVRPHEGNFGVF